MASLRHRSYQKELLDRDAIPFDAIKQNMQELDSINKLLGGHAITLRGIKTLVGNRQRENLQVVEIGCGGGDNLRVIKDWAATRGLSLTLTGIDINPECVAYAKQQGGNKGIDFICSDYRTVAFEAKPDVLFSSLFSHHFTDEELVAQLRWMRRNSRTGFFINDLHRNLLAYYSIKLLTRTFSKSYLVKNDAPLSVARGFQREDWQKLLHEAGIDTFQIRWQWAFRWLVIFVH